MNPEVTAAIAEIAASFPDASVTSFPDAHGGAYVILEPVPLGHPYKQAGTWMGFHITAACPYADVYPHFVREDLERMDGRALGEGMGPGNQFPPADAPGVTEEMRRKAIQISRRANHRDPNGRLETPLIKLLKVLKWLMSR